MGEGTSGVTDLPRQLAEAQAESEKWKQLCVDLAADVIMLAREREADRDLIAGRVKSFENLAQMLNDLDEVGDVSPT